MGVVVLCRECCELRNSNQLVLSLSFFSWYGRSYPELVAPLITERDLYLAWSLKRSKAVNGAGVVVGVVGRGHLRGVVHALLRDRGGAGLRWVGAGQGGPAEGDSA